MRKGGGSLIPTREKSRLPRTNLLFLHTGIREPPPFLRLDVLLMGMPVYLLHSRVAVVTHTAFVAHESK